MRKKKPKPRVTPRKNETLDTLQRFLDKVVPDYTKRLQRAEAIALSKENELAFLKDKLAGLLTVEQFEAAKICQMEPALYALNWIELQTEGKMGFQAPSFPKYVRNLATL